MGSLFDPQVLLQKGDSGAGGWTTFSVQVWEELQWVATWGSWTIRVPVVKCSHFDGLMAAKSKADFAFCFSILITGEGAAEICKLIFWLM